jgi:hypothetical protein
MKVEEMKLFWGRAFGKSFCGKSLRQAVYPKLFTSSTFMLNV